MELTTLQQKEISEVLAQFSLNAKEQAVYLALLQMGQTQLTPLASTASLPATTVQSILARLAREGFIAVTKQKSRGVYEAYDPAVLKKILQERLEDAAGIIPLLKRLQAEKGVAVKIRVHFRERMTDIFQQALQARKKTIYEIVSAKDLQETLGEKFHFTRRRLESGIRLKSLRVESKEIKKYSRDTHIRELREAKFLPRDMDFRANILFWDNTVAFFSSKEEGLACTVESASIREMLTQIFDLLWSVSRPMVTE